jgi:hypothetical protein
MTTDAAKMLDDAHALFYKIACAPDDSGISTQTHSANPHKTPYDFAAQLVQSLLPYAYNYGTADREATEWIWEQMLDCGEIIDIKFVNEYFTERGYPNV